MIWDDIKAHRPNQCLDMSPQLQRTIREWLRVYAELAGETPQPGWYLYRRCGLAARPGWQASDGC